MSTPLSHSPPPAGPGAAVFPAAGGHSCPRQQETEHPILHRSLKAQLHLRETSRTAWKTYDETGHPQSRNQTFLRRNWAAPKGGTICQETASYPRQTARWPGQFWALCLWAYELPASLRLWFSTSPPEGAPSQHGSECRPGQGPSEGSGFYELNLSEFERFLLDHSSRYTLSREEGKRPDSLTIVS